MRLGWHGSIYVLTLQHRFTSRPANSAITSMCAPECIISFVHRLNSLNLACTDHNMCNVCLYVRCAVRAGYADKTSRCDSLRNDFNIFKMSYYIFSEILKSGIEIVDKIIIIIIFVVRAPSTNRMEFINRNSSCLL